MSTYTHHYDPVILTGDRVALAPHLDLWIAGVRFGTLVKSDVVTTDGAWSFIHHVEANGRTYALRSTDILGAVR